MQICSGHAIDHCHADLSLHIEPIPFVDISTDLSRACAFPTALSATSTGAFCAQNQLGMTYVTVCTGQSNPIGLSQTLLAFKQYLDTNGMLLAKDPHLLSYYALPFVHDPQNHPSFAPLFTPSFASDLRLQLSNILGSPSDESSLPRLYSMYAAAHKTALTSNSDAKQSGKVSLQPFLSLDYTAALPHAASQSFSGVANDNSSSVSRAMTGKGHPFSGASKGSSRPLSALLNGSKELADLVSVSQPRYADHLQMPSLEPSAEVLHGQSTLCSAGLN